MVTEGSQLQLTKQSINNPTAVIIVTLISILSGLILFLTIESKTVKKPQKRSVS